MSGNTALIIVDPLNEFLHPDGKLYPLLKESVVASDTVNNIVKVITAARKANVPIFYGLHQLYQDGVYDGWNYMTKNHYRNKSKEMFKKDSFGAQVYEGMQPEKGDVVVARHWNGR
jgi:nicotinamidase-related amidase